MSAPLAVGFWNMIDALGAWMVIASVQVALLGIVVALADRILDGRVWPQLRAAMWWMVLLALVIPPMFDSPISLWRCIDPAAKVYDVVRPASAHSAGGLRIEDMFEARLVPRAVERHAGGQPLGRTLVRLLVAVWLAGIVASAVATRARHTRERRQWLGPPSLRQPSWLARLVRQSADRLGLKRAPSVRISLEARGAAVVGFWRPVVVLPASLLRDAPREQVWHVLVHEFAHVRRRDALAALASTWIQMVYWFHPAAWVARSRLETLREICCDQAAIAALNDSSGGYRRTLLGLARSMLLPRSTVARLAFVHRHSQIMARLMHLQRPIPGRPGLVRAASTTILAMLLVCCVPRVAPTSRPADSPAVMKWEDLPGCFQLRYAVMRAMAERAARENPD